MPTHIFITGHPGIGKTTLVRKVVERLSLRPRGFYTEEIREKGERVGFKIRTFDGKEAVLAHVRIDTPFRVGRYCVSVENLEKTGVPAIKALVPNRECEPDPAGEPSRDRKGATRGPGPLADARGSDSVRGQGPCRAGEPSRDREGATRGLETQPVFPLAYLLTFTCYGTRLHGRSEGSVDREHNVPGSPYLDPNPVRLKSERQRMPDTPYVMDQLRARTAATAVKEACEFRKWGHIATHVRSTHVHVLLQACETPEKVMNDLKSYASRALNRAGFENARRKRWTRHGSTRYLWRPSEVEAAFRYVVHGQGESVSASEGGEDNLRIILGRTGAAWPLADARGSDRERAGEQSRDREGATRGAGIGGAPEAAGAAGITWPLADARGSESARGSDRGELVVVDELGRMELFSKAFQKSVLQLLDSGARVFGVIQDRSNPFLDAIRARPDVKIVRVTEENRTRLVEELSRTLRA